MGCVERLQYVWQRVGKQKEVGETDTHTSLHRCLSTFQMTTIGLGSTIGVGIYVLLGVAIRDYAGPGVVLSFLLAGLVVLSNAVIYAEFGSYIPHTGAAYTYMYKAVGELAAFLTGWMGLFSLVCSAATGARAWSGFVDSLFDNAIQTFFDDKVGQLDIGPPFAHSLDWMAFTFFLALTLVVSCNIQCSSIINIILAVLTTGVLVFVMIAGPIVGDVGRLVDSEHGGFLPYGFGGVVSGASAAFFAFNGYDSICIAAEEAKDPVKSVPRAILIELLIVTIVYCGAAVGTVSLIPYTEIDLRAPIPSAFAYQGMTWARYIVTIGPVIAMTNLSLMSLYAQSRIFYRMAQDGLMFKRFAYINPVTKSPLLGVGVCGVLVAIISLLLELKDLVRFTVLCMLFQYIVLAPALVNLRVTDHPSNSQSQNSQHTENFREYSDSPRQDPRSISSQPKEMAVLNHDDSELESSSLVDDGSPGQTSARTPPSSTTYSYVTDGDLGFGSRPDSRGDANEFGDFPFNPRAVSNASGASALNAGVSQQNTDSHQDVNQGSSEISQSEDNIFQRNADPASSELADESHFSEESRGGELFSDSSKLLEQKRGGLLVNTVSEFYKLLTTKVCLVILVVLLAALALQIGLGWEDLRKGRAVAVVCVLLLTVFIIFLCEVVRKRCGSGNHDGFKVPLVPYIPVLSCFMNMLLLVTAADYTGIIEFSVLVCAGLVVYVLMVMSQWSEREEVGRGYRVIQTQERRNLLAYDDDDADSEGSL